MLHVLLLRRSKAALAEVYRRHGDAVFGAARLAANRTTTAEDLTCARFLALWHNPGTYDPRLGSFRSHLIAGIGRRLSGSVPAGGRASTPSAQGAVPVAHPGAAHVLLEGIPADEALVVDLAHFGRHTCQQIAQLVNEPEPRIRDRVRDALTRLAENAHGGRARRFPEESV